ncbi:MAG: hypothetical protein V7772_06110 [Pseudomonas profundi]
MSGPRSRYSKHLIFFRLDIRQDAARHADALTELTELTELTKYLGLGR